MVIRWEGRGSKRSGRRHAHYTVSRQLTAGSPSKRHFEEGVRDGIQSTPQLHELVHIAMQPFDETES